MDKPCIRDLVCVPEVKTVIQMSDIEDENLRQFLTESFVLTDEVKRILETTTASIMRGEGRGFFLEGNFGSGKSHLLSVLSLLLESKTAWEPLQNQVNRGESPRLAEAYRNLDIGNYVVINISLVEHSHREYLEDIVTSAIGRALDKRGEGVFNYAQSEDFVERIQILATDEFEDKLEDFLNKHNLTRGELFSTDRLSLIEDLLAFLDLPYRFRYNRQEIFSGLREIIADRGLSGMVILIDELSEFLRSKTDGRRFNEDIRFLQYLGELCPRFPAWVMATLQEEIEKTGETTPEAFNKIKDRYPTRFRLTGDHIKELIATRLIKLKPGSEKHISEVYSFYHRSFTDWPVTDEEFRDLYPVHPLTIEFLDNLKPLFSQHRGIIDFVHYQLRGDEDRNLEGMLEEPCHQLLTPDKIFDHFTERIREMMETSPYYEKVYTYYDKEIAHILPPEDERLGQKLIKVLILIAISPLDKEYSVREIAEMLLFQLTDLDPEVNYEHIDQVLDKLFQNGAYLQRKEGSSPLENIYSIDLEADINLILKRRLEYIKSSLFPDDHRLFTRLGKNADSSLLPLEELMELPQSTRRVTWQNTERQGYLIFSPLSELGREKMSSLAESLQKDEEDFALCIGWAHSIPEQREHLKSVIFPALEDITDLERNSFAFWLPQPLGDNEFLKDALARILLWEEYEDDPSETGAEIRKKLEADIQKDREHLNRIFSEAYREGTIYSGSGKELSVPSRRATVPFREMSEQIIFNLLSRRFPAHVNIAPYQNFLNRGQIAELQETFFMPGGISGPDELSGSLQRIIDSFLKPMNLVKKTRQGRLSLHIEPDNNPLVGKFMEAIADERTPISTIYHRLRKGSFGLSRRQFKLLVGSLLYAGYITAYSEERKIALSQFSFNRFDRIEYIGPGELISEDFLRVLSECQLLPPRLKKPPFSLAKQNTIWEYVTEKKRDMTDTIQKLRTKIRDVTADGSLSSFEPENLMDCIHRVSELLDEIKVSYSSGEGLERFAAHYRSRPHIDNHLKRFSALAEFIEERLANYRSMREYLNHPRLDIPDDQDYQKLYTHRRNLLTALDDQEIIFDKDFFSRTESSFEDFQEDYSSRYTSEHQKKLGPERLAPYRKLIEGRGYSALKQLASIEMISVKDDRIKVDRMVQRIEEQICRDLKPGHLKQVPACSCGFTLGAEVKLPQKTMIQKTIERGIGQYLENLQDPEYRPLLEDFLEHMEAAGEKRFAKPIQKLLSLTPDTPELIPELTEILNRNLINRINRALSGEISLVERDLDLLYENLVGRSFSPRQLKAIFKEWLQGPEGLKENAYIRITSGTSKPPKQNDTIHDTLATFLKKRFPELVPLLSQLEFEDFLLLCADAEWNAVHFSQADQNSPISGPVREVAGIQDSHQNSLQEMISELASEGSLKQLKKAISSRLDDTLKARNLWEPLIDALNPSSLTGAAEILSRERLSQLLCFRIFLILIQMVENSEQQVIEKALQVLSENSRETALFDRRDWIVLADHYLRLEQNMLYADQMEKPSGQEGWEKLYRLHLCELEYRISRIKVLTRRLNLTDQVPTARKEQQVNSLLHNCNQAFADHRKNRRFRIADREQAKNSPVNLMTLEDLILDEFPQMLQKMSSQGGTLLLMDGMRWDIWKRIKKEMADLPLRTIDEGSLLASYPTTTEKQLELLEEAGFQGEILDAEEIADPASEGNQILKVSYIDNKVHTSRDDYGTLIDEILFQTRSQLHPLLCDLPSGHPVLVFSDHGFRINQSFQPRDKYSQARYLHGEDSLAEVIVPWALLYRT